MNKKIILALLLVAFLAMPVAVPVAVPAENSLMSIASSSVINIATATATPPAIDAAPDVPLVRVITNVINVLFFILVSVAAIFVILGAFTILTAEGDAEKMGKGRSQITYAIVAVVLAIAAQGIIAFIEEHIAAQDQAQGIIAFIRAHIAG